MLMQTVGCLQEANCIAHSASFLGLRLHHLVQERCIAAVERANGAEAREAALAEEKAQLKAGMKVAFSRQEELEESLAAATADAADLRTQVGGAATMLWATVKRGLQHICNT